MTFISFLSTLINPDSETDSLRDVVLVVFASFCNFFLRKAEMFGVKSAGLPIAFLHHIIKRQMGGRAHGWCLSSAMGHLQNRAGRKARKTRTQCALAA